MKVCVVSELPGAVCCDQAGQRLTANHSMAGTGTVGIWPASLQLAQVITLASACRRGCWVVRWKTFRTGSYTTCGTEKASTTCEADRQPFGHTWLHPASGKWRAWKSGAGQLWSSAEQMLPWIRGQKGQQVCPLSVPPPPLPAQGPAVQRAPPAPLSTDPAAPW